MLKSLGDIGLTRQYKTSRGKPTNTKKQVDSRYFFLAPINDCIQQNNKGKRF